MCSTRTSRRSHLELDSLRDPQHLAVAAKELGMVLPEPAFVASRPGEWWACGLLQRSATRPGRPAPAQKPALLTRKPVIVKLPQRRPDSPRRPYAVGDSGTATPEPLRTDERNGR